MDTGQEQNYWPGFVDALSNVVLTLVFVLVIFVFALAMASNKVEEKMRQVTEVQNAKVEEDQNQVVNKQQIEDLQKQLEEAQAQLAALQAKGFHKEEDKGKLADRETSSMQDSKSITVEDQNAPEEKEGSVNVANDQKGMLSLEFPQSVSKIDDKSQESLGELVTSVQSKTGAKTILIKSIMGNETYSIAQRVAYYRAVNVRNMLITKLKIEPSTISSAIVSSDTPGAGRVEIIFKK